MGNKTGGVSESEIADDNKITIEEVEALKAAFHAGNKKGGPVKLAKFKKIVAEVNKLHESDNWTPEVAELIFSILDADKNGKIDAEEFIHGVTVLSSGSVEDKARMVFHAIDKNNSGKINKSEFRVYVSKTVEVSKNVFNKEKKDDGLNLAMRMGLKMAMKIGEGKIIDQVTEEAFEADKDGDGEISLEEWVAAATSGRNNAIESFLNPGEQVKDGVTAIGEALSEAGLVTSKEDFAALKKDVLED